MNALPSITIRSADGASAEIYLHGAHVTSWKTPDGREQMFVSRASEFRDGEAIRGGVPVVFPQFSGLGNLNKHGFARNMSWQLVEAGSGIARLRLTDSAATLQMWPHPFAAELKVGISGSRLEMTLEVENTGSQDFDFTTALHTYLRVDDTAQCRVEGLNGTTFRNNPTQTECPETANSIVFGTEIDRTYLDTGSREVLLHDGARVVKVTQQGFHNTVVWNPAQEVGSKIADMEPDGWLRYVCIEAAAVKPALKLRPGERWSGAQHIDAQG